MTDDITEKRRRASAILERYSRFNSGDSHDIAKVAGDLLDELEKTAVLRRALEEERSRITRREEKLANGMLGNLDLVEP